MDKGRLRRVELGKGTPDVILEAGHGSAAASWKKVMPILAPHVHVVAYDRAGLGGSAPAPGPDPAVVGRQAEDLISLISEVAEGRCVLVGHSWGGMLVQLAAFRRPDLVCGLVLVDPAHEEMGVVLPRIAQWAMWAGRKIRPDDLQGSDPAISAAIFSEVRASPRSFPNVPVIVLSAGRGFPRRFRTHWTKLQAGLAEAAPQGRHIVVAGVGHNIPWFRPDAVADAVLRVVTQVRAGAEGPE